MPSAEDVKKMVSKLHDAGIVNIDKPVREVFEKTIASQPAGGTTDRPMVIAYGHYALVVDTLVSRVPSDKDKGG
jgi:hypothetical protein